MLSSGGTPFITVQRCDVHQNLRAWVKQVMYNIGMSSSSLGTFRLVRLSLLCTAAGRNHSSAQLHNFCRWCRLSYQSRNPLGSCSAMPRRQSRKRYCKKPTRGSLNHKHEELYNTHWAACCMVTGTDWNWLRWWQCHISPYQMKMAQSFILVIKLKFVRSWPVWLHAFAAQTCYIAYSTFTCSSLKVH